MKLLVGKYFNGKEQIVDCFTFLMKEDFVQDEEVVEKYLTACC